MNKKLLVAAIGAALVGGAAVAQAEVKLYGHGHLSVDSLDRDNNADDGSLFVSDNSSRIGIRATEDVGGGLKAVAQFELLLGGDTTTTKGEKGIDTNRASPSTNRDNYVGLEGGFGALRIGVIDTATKDIGGIADLFYREQLGESRAIINVGGADARVESGVHYLSPDFGGLSFKFQYGTEDDFASDDKIMAANVRWTAGPLTLGLGILNDENTGVGVEDTDVMRAAVKFDVGGGFTVAALYQTVDNIGGANGADQDAMGIGASFKAGNNIFKAQFYTADERDNAPNTGGDQTSIGWDHLFSKTVKGYVTYATTSNESAATFGVGGNGHGESAVPAQGQDASGFSVGMIVDF